MRRRIFEDALFSYSADSAETRGVPFSSIVSLFSCLSRGGRYTSMQHYIGDCLPSPNSPPMLARLAVDRKEQGRGLGGALLKERSIASLLPLKLLERELY